MAENSAQDGLRRADGQPPPLWRQQQKKLPKAEALARVRTRLQLSSVDAAVDTHRVKQGPATAQARTDTDTRSFIPWVDQQAADEAAAAEPAPAVQARWATTTGVHAQLRKPWSPSVHPATPPTTPAPVVWDEAEIVDTSTPKPGALHANGSSGPDAHRNPADIRQTDGALLPPTREVIASAASDVEHGGRSQAPTATTVNKAFTSAVAPSAATATADGPAGVSTWAALRVKLSALPSVSTLTPPPDDARPLIQLLAASSPSPTQSAVLHPTVARSPRPLVRKLLTVLGPRTSSCTSVAAGPSPLLWRKAPSPAQTAIAL
jgi:hypothetical protein